MDAHENAVIASIVTLAVVMVVSVVCCIYILCVNNMWPWCEREMSISLVSTPPERMALEDFPAHIQESVRGVFQEVVNNAFHGAVRGALEEHMADQDNASSCSSDHGIVHDDPGPILGEIHVFPAADDPAIKGDLDTVVEHFSGEGVHKTVFHHK